MGKKTITTTTTVTTTTTKEIFVPDEVTNDDGGEVGIVLPEPDIYTLNPWKLTLPVDNDDQGTADEILQPELVTYESEFFYDDFSDDLGPIRTFVCPAGGATTSSAKYARSELRHLTNFAYNESTEATLQFSVEQIEPRKKVVVFQTHDRDAPEFKVVYTGSTSSNGLLRILYKPYKGASDVEVILRNDVNDGEVITLKMVRTPKSLAAYLEGTLVWKGSFVRSSGSYYWKQGNYYQLNNSSALDCVVNHYSGCVNPEKVGNLK